jgi:UDP-2-acetamido-2-deoxy-ribo-hexuluronate aminotransferase
MRSIEMVDLKTQYLKIKEEIDAALLETIGSTAFINGPQVQSFQKNLEKYLDVSHVIPCANGTDALQVAMMALGLQLGDEVIVPAFTYVATAEVIALLHLVPVMVDVDPHTFNVTAEIIEKAITPKTKAIVPVHLFGQSADMESIMAVAEKHNLFVIEDTAQAIGSVYTFSDGTQKQAGTIGHVGTTSFFPSKNLGCYGDGGAMFANDDEIAQALKAISNHGQSKTQYYHDVVGCNSRLDTVQAAVLDIKLKYLDEYAAARVAVADAYDAAFADISELQTPVRATNSTHVFHQYTMKVGNGQRDELQKYLGEMGIPARVYYPLPLDEQPAFKSHAIIPGPLTVTKQLCKEVLSLPIHTEMEDETLQAIINGVKSFYKK